MTTLMIGLQGSVPALSLFMLANSISPGPNNLMLLHGGIKRGFWACRGHMMGVTTGVIIMLWLSYWGIAQIVVEHPQVMLSIKILGSLYLLWLTWQMAKTDFIAVVQKALYQESLDKTSATNPDKKGFGDLPLTFWQALMLQGLNPKAWTITMIAPTLAMISLGLAEATPWLDNWSLLVLCAVINVTSIGWWAAGGQWLRKLVDYPRVMKGIHSVIVLMTFYCALSLWL